MLLGFTCTELLSGCFDFFDSKYADIEHISSFHWLSIIRMVPQLAVSTGSDDIAISHASEVKDGVAQPLSPASPNFRRRYQHMMSHFLA